MSSESKAKSFIVVKFMDRLGDGGDYNPITSKDKLIGKNLREAITNMTPEIAKFILDDIFDNIGSDFDYNDNTILNNSEYKKCVEILDDEEIIERTELPKDERIERKVNEDEFIKIFITKCKLFPSLLIEYMENSWENSERFVIVSEDNILYRAFQGTLF